MILLKAEREIHDSWHGCYDAGWRGEIVPEAFAHPAKMSRALVRRIYAHAFAEGWLRAGHVVCDPFGGIAGTALDAMWNGLAWIGVELEPRFVALAEQNIDLWRRKYGSKAGFGSARIVQGDSRRLAGVIQSANCMISSPPYARGGQGGGGDRPEFKFAHGISEYGTLRDGYGESPGQLGAMKEGEPPRVDCVVSSPPYCNDVVNDRNGIDRSKMGNGRPGGPNSQAGGRGYGRESGQVGAMPAGKFDAVVSSPPFSHPNEQPVASQSRLLKEGYEKFKSPAKMARGSADGNLESMPGGRFDAVVSSPPFEKGAEGAFKASKWKNASDALRAGCGHGASDEARLRQLERDEQKTYGNSAGQLGQDTGETFWEASRAIIQQCRAILKPGGHAIWVCKDFVRKGKRVPFSDQWQALCEAEGFQLVCRRRAMLVEHHGEQYDMLGEAKHLRTERKSFFRRLAEKKGAPAIDFEDVICLVRV